MYLQWLKKALSWLSLKGDAPRVTSHFYMQHIVLTSRNHIFHITTLESDFVGRFGGIEYRIMPLLNLCNMYV